MCNVIKTAALAAVVAGLLGGSAQAAQLTGSYSVAGGFVPVTLAGTATSLAGADALDFVPNGVTTPTPGAPGEFLVTGATGDFAPVDTLTGQIQDISILAGGNAQYPVPPIAMFHQVGDLTFDLETFVVSRQDDEFINATGTGIFRRAGFDDTEGLMSFTAQTVNDVTFSWSSTQVATPTSVPEPASMLLMGLGLFGVAATVRRRRRR